MTPGGSGLARRGGVADVEEPAAKRRRLRGKQPCAAYDSESQGASHPWQQGGSTSRPFCPDVREELDAGESAGSTSKYKKFQNVSWEDDVPANTGELANAKLMALPKAEVNLYNCLQMVYGYCAKTMGQPLNPEDLFTYEEEVICEYPRHFRKFIKEAKYPSPEGFQQVTLERMNARWGDTKLDSVLDPSRSRNLKTEDLEKRRFLYVVAIDMHDRGLLDGNNEPTGRALQGCRLACEAFAQSSGLRLRSCTTPSELWQGERGYR